MLKSFISSSIQRLGIFPLPRLGIRSHQYHASCLRFSPASHYIHSFLDLGVMFNQCPITDFLRLYTTSATTPYVGFISQQSLALRPWNFPSPRLGIRFHHYHTSYMGFLLAYHHIHSFSNLRVTLN